MTLTDVLPQVEKLDQADLIALHQTIGLWLRELERPLGQDEINLVQERYRDYLDHTEDSISYDDMMSYLSTLV